jgi:putative SOS response-associated peptidase YedK
VVTAPAVGALTEIHPRMPLVLPQERWTDWLDTSREDVEDLAAPTPPELVEALELRPVSTRVNNVANNGRELEERVESVSEPADQPALF